MHGILLVDKPVGPTSHDVVELVRRRTRIKRVGHAGTLDPLASGLLLVLIGPATKRAAQLLGLDKVYQVDALLGVRTDTGDTEGRVISRADASWEPPTEDAVVEQLQSFIGPQEQLPPMYSAIKYQGKPLYYWARRGITVPREPRRIRIAAWDLLRYDPPHVIARIHCSSGTYVRVLAETLGERLGCPAHVTNLRRTHIDTWSVAHAVTWDWLSRAAADDIAVRLVRDPELRTPNAELVPCAF